MLTLREILILGLFLWISTLKWNISRTAWPTTVIHISFFSIFKALSYESNLYFLCCSPLNFCCLPFFCCFIVVSRWLNLYHMISHDRKPLICQSVLPNFIIICDINRLFSLFIDNGWFKGMYIELMLSDGEKLIPKCWLVEKFNCPSSVSYAGGKGYL